MTNPNPGVRDHAPPGPERLLAGLTPEQAQAVTFGTGPLLLLAGPGAGKTRTLTHRAAYLLASGRAQPWEILAVTFSVRAAGELRIRLADLLGESIARGVTAATFHSVCARLLREHASVFGRTERYTIYDQADMRRVIDWLLSDAERGRDPAGAGRLRSAGERRGARRDLAREEPAAVARTATSARPSHPAAPLIAAVWRESEVELRRCNAFEFDDLLACAVRLLVRASAPAGVASPAMAMDPGRRVPGHQPRAGDAGRPARRPGRQRVRVRRRRPADPRLAPRRPAAHPRLRRAPPGHAQIVLGRNFRSRVGDPRGGGQLREPQRAPRPEGADRDARPRRPGAGPGLGQRVRRRRTGSPGRSPTRSPPARRPPRSSRSPGPATRPSRCSTRCAHAGIPHRVLGSLGLYERTEVSDALAYLTLLVEPARRAGVPARDPVAPARDRRRTVNELVTRAREQPRWRPDRRERRRRRNRAACRARRPATGWSSSGLALQSSPSRARRRTFARSRRDRGGDAAGRAGRATTSTCATTLRAPSGGPMPSACSRTCARCAAPRSPSRSSTSTRRSPASSITPPACTRRRSTRPPTGGSPSRRSTAPRAREAQLVVLLACEEQLLPSWRSLSSPDPERLAEERRLFYVAATRAKDRLLITHAAERGRRPTGGPSRFLAEAGLTDAAAPLAA